MSRPDTLRAVFLCALLLTGCARIEAPETLDGLASNTYRNPLQLALPEAALAESCADPTVIRGRAPNDGHWYMYCTTDPLTSHDRDANGDFTFHLIPMFESTDLVHWTYEGDAFPERPAYASGDAGLWAPEIQYYEYTGRYNLYYTVTDTTLPGGGSAIGVATSDGPLGPWHHLETPVIEPHAADCCPGSRRWVFDPEVLQTDGADYLYYGSYFGGVSVRVLSEDGLSTDPLSQTLVAIPNRYEGAEVAYRDGYYYLFVSATDCCRGPLTGYSVFAGRSTNPTGPFVDQEGVSFLQGRVGGTPVVSMNGNRWVGMGHNTVLTDVEGQWWTIYHAIDRFDPYFEGAVGFTKRPALLDPLDWIDGWPTVRGGRWASDTPQPVPAAQPGQKTTYKPSLPRRDQPGNLLPAYSDEFTGASLDARWTWVREPDASTYLVRAGTLRWDTQAADLFEGSNSASVVTMPAPGTPYVVETRVRLNLPPEGCCFNYTQAGLVIYGGDDNYVKLAHVSIWETRQTEWAKEEFPVPAGHPRYGNTVVSPPGDWTYLRIVERTQGGEEHYTAYTSRDGLTWTRGGTWTHLLGESARVGLVSMGGSGFTAEFDYVRVYSVNSGK